MSAQDEIQDQDAVTTAGSEAMVLTHGLGRKVIVSGVIKGLQLLLGIGSSLLLARWLGASGYGVYSFALALAMLLAIPAQLGWPTLLTREVARYQHDAGLPQLKGVLKTSTSWTALSTLAMVLVGLVIGIYVGRVKPGQDMMVLMAACALIPLLAGIGLRAAALRGLDRVMVAQVLDGILRPGLFLLLVAGLFVWGNVSPRMAISAQIMAVLASFLFGSIVLARVLPSGLRKVIADVRQAQAWRRSLWPLMFVSAAQVVTSQADLFVLGFVSETRTVGIYKVAVMVGTQVGFATWLVNAVFAPRIVKLHRSGDIAGLQALMRKGIRYVLAIAFPIALGIIVLGKPVLGMLLGPEYHDAYWPMVIVALGQLAGVTAGPVGILLGMTGHERDVARIMAGATLVSVVLTVVLASFYGAIGAAIATSSALAMTRYMMKRVAVREFPA